MNYVEAVKKELDSIYDRNPYVQLLEMKIEAVEKGKIELSMPVDGSKHTNLYGVLHGGALASLADTAMGVACATQGNRVVTVEMNINFMKSAAMGSNVLAVAEVIHAGRQTMVVETSLYGQGAALVGKARGTFMIIGHFEWYDGNE